MIKKVNIPTDAIPYRRVSTNADKISFVYAEAHVQITCVVCECQFPAFPDSTSENIFFNCPKCDRAFQFQFNIKILNNQEIIKRKEKQGLIL